MIHDREHHCEQNFHLAFTSGTFSRLEFLSQKQNDVSLVSANTVNCQQCSLLTL